MGRSLRGMLGCMTSLAIGGVLSGAGSTQSQRTPPDRISYTTFQRASNWDVYLLSRDQAPRRLTSDPALDYDAVVSPERG